MDGLISLVKDIKAHSLSASFISELREKSFQGYGSGISERINSIDCSGSIGDERISILFSYLMRFSSIFDIFENPTPKSIHALLHYAGFLFDFAAAYTQKLQEFGISAPQSEYTLNHQLMDLAGHLFTIPAGFVSKKTYVIRPELAETAARSIEITLDHFGPLLDALEHAASQETLFTNAWELAELAYNVNGYAQRKRKPGLDHALEKRVPVLLDLQKKGKLKPLVLNFFTDKHLITASYSKSERIIHELENINPGYEMLRIRRENNILSYERELLECLGPEEIGIRDRIIDFSISLVHIYREKLAELNLLSPQAEFYINSEVLDNFLCMIFGVAYWYKASNEDLPIYTDDKRTDKIVQEQIALLGEDLVLKFLHAYGTAGINSILNAAGYVPGNATGKDNIIDIMDISEDYLEYITASGSNESLLEKERQFFSIISNLKQLALESVPDDFRIYLNSILTFTERFGFAKNYQYYQLLETLLIGTDFFHSRKYGFTLRGSSAAESLMEEIAGMKDKPYPEVLHHFKELTNHSIDPAVFKQRPEYKANEVWLALFGKRYHLFAVQPDSFAYAAGIMLNTLYVLVPADIENAHDQSAILNTIALMDEHDRFPLVQIKRTDVSLRFVEFRNEYAVIYDRKLSSDSFRGSIEVSYDELIESIQSMKPFQ